jgi:Ser/Thr protein kinase RdoA (MazF antagonist)
MSLVARETHSKQLIKRVSRLYGLQPTAYSPPKKGYRNRSYAFTAGTQDFNLIVYKQEVGTVALIERANSVGDALAQAGYPARQTVDGRILRVGHRYACLYRYVSGVTIPWEAYTRRYLVELGMMMARMHHFLSKTALSLPNIEDVLAEQMVDMVAYFSQPGVQQALRAKLKLTLSAEVVSAHEPLLSDLGELSGRQPLHMDYVRGNVLFAVTSATPTITGVIDFEKAAIGHPLIDVARTLAFLAVDCKYQTPARVQRYFMHVGYLQLAQEATSNMTPTLFGGVINLFLLHDFYKFLAHNPYESLHKNLHFKRTVALLAQKRLLSVL